MTLADDPDPARWRRARDIFDVLVDLPPADRGALLDQACGADLVLRHDIESLLRFDQSTADPIEHAVVGAAQAVAQESAWDTYLTVPESIGRYRVIARLGDGGMGEVFLAEDATLGRQVAVKRPGARLAGNPSARARLFREARAAATLNHPHVCVVYEVGEDATGRPFIAMEFVDGETLAARIRRGPLALVIARPSILGSALYSTASRPSPSRTRRSKLRSSTSSKQLSRDCIGWRWRTGTRSSRGGAPTRWVGESAVRSCGCAVSSSCSSRSRRSYSESGIAGASRT